MGAGEGRYVAVCDHGDGGVGGEERERVEGGGVRGGLGAGAGVDG